jgi:hypothetical protein
MTVKKKDSQGERRHREEPEATWRSQASGDCRASLAMTAEGEGPAMTVKKKDSQGERGHREEPEAMWRSQAD